MSIGLSGYAAFPGVEQIISATYTLAHGISPGVIQIEMAPQPGFTAQSGTFAFSYGGMLLEFANCKVDAASFDASGSGFVWRLAILDRRWIWSFGQISGHYNQYRADGTIKTETRQLANQLCALCLQAMGEQGYDVSQVPSNVYPTVDWDYAVPAQALANLADQLGCHVVLRIDGTVAVLPTGSGQELPYTPNLLADSLTIDPPESPDSLAVVGAATRYQFDLPLMAVGWDVDGTVKPLAQLSYAPQPGASDGGFGQVDLHFFNSISNTAARDLAIASVFRWYQINPAKLETVPGYGGGPITDLRQILPILVEQVQTASANSQAADGSSTSQAATGGDASQAAGAPSPQPAQVFGVWFNPLCQTSDQNTCASLVPLGDGSSAQDQAILYSKPFEIDAGAGIVKFGEPVYQKTSGSGGSGGNSGGGGGGSGTTRQIAAATLMLRTSVNVKSAQTWAVDRYQRTRYQNSVADTQPQYFLHEDVELAKVAGYGTSYSDPPTVTSNQDACDQMADYYLDAVQAAYAIPQPESRSYAGLVPIVPDGAIRRVTWSVGPQGARTEASRSNDRMPYAVSYAERRWAERIGHAAGGFRKLRPTRRLGGV